MIALRIELPTAVDCQTKIADEGDAGRAGIDVLTHLLTTLPNDFAIEIFREIGEEFAAAARAFGVHRPSPASGVTCLGNGGGIRKLLTKRMHFFAHTKPGAVKANPLRNERRYTSIIRETSASMAGRMVMTQ